MTIARSIVIRFMAVWFIEGLSLLAADALVPGVQVVDTPEYPHLAIAMSVALVLAIMNALARPILLLLTLPLNMLTFGFTTLIANALTLMLAAAVLPSFQVDTFWSALAGGLVLSAVNTALTSLTTIDDDNSFYEGVVQWLSRRQQLPGARAAGRGIVLLEIDGLSFQRMRRAIDEGWMPTVRQMVRDGTHALSRADCGLPSQTSSCQAGIMYGDNDDIPAFRWYEKATGRLLVSNRPADAAELNARYARGHGLLRGGSSISNLMSGDAEKHLLTMSTLQDAPPAVLQRRQEDLYLFWLNPYVFTRTLLMTAWDVVVELSEALSQALRRQEPRMNRLHKAYPILRAVTNVFLRELSTYLVTLDIIRGAPSIYTTFVGYDEVAHHAGPDTADAMRTLRSFDRAVRRVRDVIRARAGRPYDLILLSDHGQSLGATFEQRYGQTLAELVESLAQAPTGGTTSNDTGQAFVSVLAHELRHAAPRFPGQRRDRARQSALNRAGRALQRQVERSPDAPAPILGDTPVVVCAGGNMAHIYFNLHPGRVTLDESNAAYPRLLDALARHPGVGFVIAHDAPSAEGLPEPIAFNQHGARRLDTGAVTGQDPLAPYGDPDLRAGQLLHMAEFPNAGDLIVMSAMYPDGQVAAFEELIGSHGGLGGQQTDAFLLHPTDMRVPPTVNSADLFALLDARRGLAGEPLQPAPPRALPPTDRSWTPRVLASGIRHWRGWMRRAARAMALDPRAYQEAAGDPYATGPAVLLSILVWVPFAISVALNPRIPGAPAAKVLIAPLAGYAAWLAVVALAAAAGRLLGARRGFTPAYRAMAFALTPLLLGVLRFAPGVGTLLLIMSIAVSVLAHLLALREALRLRWTLALAVPVLGAAIGAAAALAAWLALGGLSFTLETMIEFLR